MSESPAQLAGKRSRDAVGARDKDAWLAVFADDAIVEDPIGPLAQGWRASLQVRQGAQQPIDFFRL